jgi:hypothetical protein
VSNKIWGRVALAALAGACGGGHVDVQPQWRCSALSGPFIAWLTLMHTDGTCSEAPMLKSEVLKFDEGALESPIQGVIDCSTQQNDCTLAVQCHMVGNGGQLTFDGTLQPDGGEVDGRAVFAKVYSDCPSATYSVRAWPKTAPP